MGTKQKPYRRAGHVNVDTKDVARLLVIEVAAMLELCGELRFSREKTEMLKKLDEARTLLQK